MATKTEKKPLTKYQVWYRKNKKRLALARKERYHSDKAYRARNLKACKEWRKKNKPWQKREKVEREYLLISEFAEQVGCSPETLRNLEKERMLPRTTNGVARRRYHPGNVGLVKRLVDFRKDHHYSDPGYQAKVKKIVASVKTNWKKAA